MKSTTLRIVTIALALLLLVVPVSAKTAGPSQGSDAVPGPAAAPTLVDWYENWDSYPTDQNMHGIGGWKGWQNSPAATAYTRDEQSISVPNSIEIMGASDLVHEYAIDAGVWTYTAWQYVPTDFSGTSYFILLNDYDDGGLSFNWSLQVSFDSSTNLVTNDGPDGGTLPLVQGQWNEVRVEIDLDADTQTVYYGGELLFTGSWSNGMSGGGLTSIAAVDLFANGASPVYYDDLSLVEPGANIPMHINKMKMNTRPAAQPGWYKVIALVRVYDNTGTPVEGAEVFGDWTYPDGSVVPGTAVILTDYLGRTKFRVKEMQIGVYQFCVTGMTLDGYEYVPADNEDGPCISAEVSP